MIKLWKKTMKNQENNEAVFLQREKYSSRLLDGFCMLLLTIFENNACCDVDMFDRVSDAVREAYAGNIVYLKRFDYKTGREGYFVIDLPFLKAQKVLNRITSEVEGFDLYDVDLLLPKNIEK